MLFKRVKDRLVFDFMFHDLELFYDEIAIISLSAENLAIVCKLNDNVFEKIFIFLLGSAQAAIICLAFTLN